MSYIHYYLRMTKQSALKEEEMGYVKTKLREELEKGALKISVEKSKNMCRSKNLRIDTQDATLRNETHPQHSQKYHLLWGRNVALNKDNQRQIITITLDYMSRCLRVTRRNRFRMKKIWRRMAIISSITIQLENKAFQQYRQVRRMSNYRWPKI